MSFNPGGGGVASADDVALSNPVNNQAFVYDSTTEKWKNSTLTKAQIGLTNVDNTSDLNKPLSTATQTALANRLVWRGSFAAATAYTVNDAITSSEGVYRCRLGHTSGSSGPSGNGDPTYWERIGTVSGVTTNWNVRPVIYATGASSWPVGRSVPSGYTGPVTWDSMAYVAHPAPTAMVTGDDWLQRAS